MRRYSTGPIDQLSRFLFLICQWASAFRIKFDSNMHFVSTIWNAVSRWCSKLNCKDWINPRKISENWEQLDRRLWRATDRKRCVFLLDLQAHREVRVLAFLRGDWDNLRASLGAGNTVNLQGLPLHRASRF